MPVDQKERIKDAIGRIAALEDPLSDPNVKAMAGEWESYQRLRLGKAVLGKDHFPRSMVSRALSMSSRAVVKLSST
jgi:hypothetical protein